MNTLRTIVLLLTSASIIVGATSCAIFEEENRVVLDSLDRRIQPESTGGQIALAPVAIPAANIALGIDAFIVNPAVALPNAAVDTYEIYWDDQNEQPLVEAMLVPPKAILTPPTFVLVWLWRTAFDPREGELPFEL